MNDDQSMEPAPMEEPAHGSHKIALVVGIVAVAILAGVSGYWLGQSQEATKMQSALSTQRANMQQEMLAMEQRMMQEKEEALTELQDKMDAMMSEPDTMQAAFSVQTTRYENEQMGIGFMYPSEWGQIEASDATVNTSDGQEVEGQYLTLLDSIFLAGLDGEERVTTDGDAYWTDMAKEVTSKEGVESFCDNRQECEIVQNKNGIMVAQSIENLIADINPDFEDFVTTQYYIYIPNADYSGLVVSSVELEQAGVENAGQYIEALVNSIELVE